MRILSQPIWKQKVSLSIDIVVIILVFVSCILCVRSLIRRYHTYQDACKFFMHWYGLQLHNVKWDFISPWYFLMLISSIFILLGSIVKTSIEKDILENFRPCSYLLASGTMMVWLGLLRYVGYSYKNSILLRTINRAIPSLLRFMLCSLIMYFAFVLFAWIVLGPYHVKFRSFMKTLECLFSLINGDDMYVTFAVIKDSEAFDIVFFSRVYLYVFIVLFIYVVLNLFVTLIFEAYEEVKDNPDGKSLRNPLWNFLDKCDLDPHDSIFSEDYERKDKRLLLAKAIGLVPINCSIEPEEVYFSRYSYIYSRFINMTKFGNSENNDGDPLIEST